MVKSVRRKGVKLWCISWQDEERIISGNEKRRRSRAAGGGIEAWREVSKNGRRVGNREEEAGNSKEKLGDERGYCTWGEI